MLKYSCNLSLLLIIILFSSCFELREEIDLNKDGSGTYRLLLDMSQSKATIDLAQKMKQDDESNKNLTTTIDSTFAKSVMRFSQIKGISQAKDSVNKVDYVFGVLFKFENIEALNNAMAELNKDENGQSTLQEAVYSFKKNVFERQNIYYFNNISDALKNKTEKEKAEQMRNMFDGASYINLLKINGKIKKYSNSKAELDYTKTVLRLAVPLPDAIEGKAALGNVVKIK
jgi:hypothetical protein